MKAEGWEFPPIREAEAMFEADVAPEWHDGDVCHRCRVQVRILQDLFMLVWIFPDVIVVVQVTDATLANTFLTPKAFFFILLTG